MLTEPNHLQCDGAPRDVMERRAMQNGAPGVPSRPLSAISNTAYQPPNLAFLCVPLCPLW